MAITYGNPIVATSGTSGLIVNGRIKVDQLYWHQPTLESTSSLIIAKRTGAGIVYTKMTCETSGESQVIDLNGRWMNDPFLLCVPTGTLYIYTE